MEILVCMTLEWLVGRLPRHASRAALPIALLASAPGLLLADNTRIVQGNVVRYIAVEDASGNPGVDVPRQFACEAKGVTPDGTTFDQTFNTALADGAYTVSIPGDAKMVTMSCLGAGTPLYSNFIRTLPLPSDGSPATFTIPIPQDVIDTSNLTSRLGGGYVEGTEPLHALDVLQVLGQNATYTNFGTSPLNICIPTPQGPLFLVVDDPTLYPGTLRYHRGDLTARWSKLPVPVFLNLGAANATSDVQAAEHAAVNSWNGSVRIFAESSTLIPDGGYGINLVYTSAETDYSPNLSDGKDCGGSPVHGTIRLLIGTNAGAVGTAIAHELGHGLDHIHTPEDRTHDTLLMDPDGSVNVIQTYLLNGQRANPVLLNATQYEYGFPLVMGVVDGTPIYTNVLSYSNPSANNATLDPTMNPNLCTFKLTPIGDTFPTAGGTATITIDTASYCTWSASDPVPWTTPTGATTRTGPGTFTFQVPPNTGATRTGTLTIAGTTVKIAELGDSVTDGLYFVPVKPCRVEDTRNGNGPYGGPALQGGDTRIFNIPQSGCNIPFTAKAYSFNATIVPVSQGPVGFVTLWPAGQAQPNASTLNSWDGRVVANAAIISAGTNGGVSVFSSHPTDVILDINGYFDTLSTTTAYSFYPVSPCRVADTRWPVGIFGGPALADGETRDFPIANSSCGIPPEASAGSFNFTVVPSGYLGYLSTWPTGEDQPNVSTLNSWDGRVVANAGIVLMGTNGINMFATDPTHAIIDTNGYFALPGSPGALLFHPMTPCRVEDTRNPDGPFGGPILKGGTTRSFAIPASSCNVPNTAAAYVFNLTLVPTQYLGYATLAPTGPPLPYVSTDNSWTGTVVANMAIVPAGIDGSIDLYVTQDTHAILDITGYFALE